MKASSLVSVAFQLILPVKTGIFKPAMLLGIYYDMIAQLNWKQTYDIGILVQKGFVTSLQVLNSKQPLADAASLWYDYNLYSLHCAYLFDSITDWLVQSVAGLKTYFGHLSKDRHQWHRFYIGPMAEWTWISWGCTTNENAKLQGQNSFPISASVMALEMLEVLTKN